LAGDSGAIFFGHIGSFPAVEIQKALLDGRAFWRDARRADSSGTVADGLPIPDLDFFRIPCTALNYMGENFIFIVCDSTGALTENGALSGSSAAEAPRRSEVQKAIE
jgi:hypothetical protein